MKTRFTCYVFRAKSNLHVFWLIHNTQYKHHVNIAQWLAFLQEIENLFSLSNFNLAWSTIQVQVTKLSKLDGRVLAHMLLYYLSIVLKKRKLNIPVFVGTGLDV